MTSAKRHDPEKADVPLQEGEPPAPPLPPDGGWGWVVVFASLVCNIIVDGICFSFGMFFLGLLDYYGESKGKTAFVGSLIPGMYLGMGPIASALANKYSIRLVTITGSVIASVSFFVCTYSPNLNVLIFVYGICGGIGFGLMYLPSIVIVNFYFARKRALATGIAVCGSGIGTFVFTAFAPYLIRNYGWKGSYWIISGIILNGIVCALVFRPLEAEKQKPPRPAISSDDIPIKRGIIMEKIIEEKKRQRTISEHTLDGAIITKNNEIIKDKSLIKKVLLKPLAEESGELVKKTPSDGDTLTEQLLPNGSPQDNSDLLDDPTKKLGGLGKAYKSPLNKHLERVKGNVMGSGPILISSTTSLGKRKRTTSNASELWRRGDFGSRSNLEQQEFKKEIARPMYRQDIFYTGSVTSLAMYQSNRSLKSYVDSNTSIPEPEPEEVGTCQEKCLPLIHILREMLDFSLLKSPTFIPLCLTSVLAMLGFFTPFVYLVDYSVAIGIDLSSSAMLLQVLGIANTIGRILSGWISDRPWADCLLIHNLALIIGGLATCFVPYVTSWPILVIYCIIFGKCIAAFIALRTIVLTDLLGIEKLSSSFGILLLFQGIASLTGTPLSGAIYDATQEYIYSFMISGILIFTAGAISLPVRKIKAWEERRNGLIANPEDYPPAPSLNGDVNSDTIGSAENKSSKSATFRDDPVVKIEDGTDPKQQNIPIDDIHLSADTDDGKIRVEINAEEGNSNLKIQRTSSI